MRETWNEITYWLKTCKERCALEKEYENTIVQCLGYLGWKKSIGEISTQYAVQVGHETKLADIVVSSGSIENFVIEVKRPGHIVRHEDERQLVSYMRLVKHPVSFGLYIGDDIRLYYDNGSSFPELIFALEINACDERGERFVELFSRNSFSSQRLKQYCEDVLSVRKRKEKLNRELDDLCSEQGEVILKELFVNYLIEKGYDKNLVESGSENILISAKRKAPKTECVNSGECLIYESKVSSSGEGSNIQSHVHRSYKFNEIICAKPAELAFLIVKQYVEDNPTLTFDDIREIFMKKARLLTREEYERKKRISVDPNFDKRWFHRSEAVILSSDNVEFMVQTGWNYYGYADNRPSNICVLIDFARRQGYTIDEL